MLKVLSGYKTYIIGAATILYGAVGLWAKGDIDTNIGLILAGLGMMGIRNGITAEVAQLAETLLGKQGETK